MFLDCNHPRFSYPPYIVSTVYLFQYRHDRAKESAIRPVDRYSPERPLFFISYIRNVRVTNREQGLSSTKSSSDEGTDHNDVHGPLKVDDKKDNGDSYQIANYWKIEYFLPTSTVCVRTQNKGHDERRCDTL